MSILGLEFEEIGSSNQKNGVTILARVKDESGNFTEFFGADVVSSIYMSPTGATIAKGFTSGVERGQLSESEVKSTSYTNGKLDEATRSRLEELLTEFTTESISKIRKMLEKIPSKEDPKAAPVAASLKAFDEPEAPAEDPPVETYVAFIPPQPRPVSFNRKKGGR
jgi:hypothetical protein